MGAMNRGYRVIHGAGVVKAGVDQASEAVKVPIAMLVKTGLQKIAEQAHGSPS